MVAISHYHCVNAVLDIFPVFKNNYDDGHEAGKQSWYIFKHKIFIFNGKMHSNPW